MLLNFFENDSGNTTQLSELPLRFFNAAIRTAHILFSDIFLSDCWGAQKKNE